MADRKQSREFLGGGPKFNSVGRGISADEASEEPAVPIDQTGYWVRVGLIGLVVVALAVTLFILNDKSLGKTTQPPTRLGGHTLSPDTSTPPSLQ